MSTFKGANLALRFLLELCAFATFGYWGFQSESGWVRILLMVGLPMIAAIAWGTFVSPKAKVRVSELARLAIEVVIFGLAVAALLDRDDAGLAVALAATYILNRTLLFVLDQ